MATNKDMKDMEEAEIISEILSRLNEFIDKLNHMDPRRVAGSGSPSFIRWVQLHDSIFKTVLVYLEKECPDYMKVFHDVKRYHYENLGEPGHNIKDNHRKVKELMGVENVPEFMAVLPDYAVALDAAYLIVLPSLDMESDVSQYPYPWGPIDYRNRMDRRGC